MKTFRLLALACAMFAITASATPTAAQDDKKDDKGKATVVLTQHFPFRVLWSAGDDTGEIEDKDSAEVPVGKISIQPANRFHGEYASMFVKYRLNKGKLSALTDKAWDGELKKGDKLEIIQVAVAAPAHAVLVPYKDGQILVSVIHPVAISNEDAKFDPTGKEEFRSTALFFAKYGFTKMAHQLAKDSLEAMPNFEANKGKLRNKQQVGIVFPMKGGKLLPGQAKGSEDDLTEAIEIAFRTIGKQNVTADGNFNEQIEAGEKILRKKKEI